MKKFFANISRSRRRSDPSMGNGNGASGGSSPTSGTQGSGGAASASTSRPTSGVVDKSRTTNQGGSNSARSTTTNDHSAINLGGKMFNDDDIQRILKEKDEIIKKQEHELKSQVKRIEELEAQAKSLQVRLIFFCCSFLRLL